jgi:type IV fimbrial biogenesis protein FimT
MKLRGFSLLEVTLSLAIITLLAAISLPALNDIYHHTQQKQLRSQLMHALELARHQALAQETSVVMCKSDQGFICSNQAKNKLLIFINPSEDGLLTDPHQLLFTLPLLTSQGTVHWRSFSSHRDYLVFSSQGTLQNDNGTFWYCANHTSFPVWAVIVNQSGRARYLEPNRQDKIIDGQGKQLKCE